MHDFVIDLITRHRTKPFYVYCCLFHVHTETLLTPDSAHQSKDLYDDNIRCMAKLVGRLVAGSERLKLRDNTLIIFVGDNGTATGAAARSSIGGRRLSGSKGSMLKGGALVPLIANWPGKTPAGKVTLHFIDSTDFHPTFAELARVKLNAKTVSDGHSFVPQLRGTSH